MSQSIKNEAVGAAINAAARDLPEGWSIIVQVERHSGWAELYNPDGAKIPSECSTDCDLHDSIHHLIWKAQGKEVHK